MTTSVLPVLYPQARAWTTGEKWPRLRAVDPETALSYQDWLEACEVQSVARNAQGKTVLTWIVSMLTKLRRRNHEVQEVTVSYSGFDYGNDNDYENEQTCPGY